MSSKDVIAGLDAAVNDFLRRTRYFHEELTPGRAKMFVMQHRLNSRYRNSVLKLRVATNCPDWDIRLRIIAASSQEIIADDEFGGGRSHWQIMEDLSVAIGLDRAQIRNAEPVASTRLAWSAWDGLMSNVHWLEGLIANTCAERINVTGYGEGAVHELGWSGAEGERWRKLLGLSDDQLEFFKIHGPADIEHSDLGWKTVAERATEMRMEDAVVEACRRNLVVWEHYFNGIGDAGDKLN
jgi:pyrroloquinoline quinone (PQQ) biosynthesis protein C